MKRLLYINNRYRHYDALKYRTLGRNFELTVLWIGPPPPAESPASDLLRLFRHETLSPQEISKLQPWHCLRSLRLYRRVASLATEFDLVLSSTSDSWKSKVAYAAASRSRTPIAFRKERWLDLETPRLTRAYWRLDQHLTDFIERRSRGMLVGGRKAREYLLARGHTPESVLPFSYLHEDLADKPTNPQVYDELRAFAGESLLLLYLGRIMPQKGLDVLIAVVRTMIAEGSDLKLVVAGEPISLKTGRGDRSTGYFERCLRLAKRNERIRFLGPIAADRVHDYYRAADVFVHPHVHRVGGREKHDGWGNVITEAASLSTAILASDRVAAAFDIIEPGVSGFLLRSADLENDLRRALEHLCDHRDEVESFGREARRRYELTVDADRTVASIHELIDRGRDRPEASA